MKIKSPMRLIIALITVLIIIWMCCNFTIALISDQTFSFWGNTLHNEPQTFVVAGVDADGYRTDLILLCQVNRRDNKVSVLQVPRDTRVENRRNDKKINSAYYSGFDVMANEIAQVTGVTPEHYVMVSFEAFRDIVDALGGVKMEIPMDMQYKDPVQGLVIDLKQGTQRLNGEKAEMYMRYRSGYAQGDIGRLNAQQELYAAIREKLFSFSGTVRIPAVFFAVQKHTDTDLSGEEMLSLIRDVLAIGKDNIQILSIPGEGKYIGGRSYFVPYVNQTKTLMQEHFVLDTSQ